MSPNMEIGDVREIVHLHGNGLTIVNGYDFPYHFPHSMTLFQPSQDQYDGQNLAKDSEGKTNFIKWFEMHSRRTIVSMIDTYGGNVSNLKCLGPGSYEIELSTYSPTGIVVSDSNGDETLWNLDSEQYRSIRGGDDLVNRYEGGKYVFDNGQNAINGEFPSVGFMFNMYDTFITGMERTLRMTVPKDKDFNKLVLKFGWEVRDRLQGKMQAIVRVNENVAFDCVVGED